MWTGITALGIISISAETAKPVTWAYGQGPSSVAIFTLNPVDLRWLLSAVDLWLQTWCDRGLKPKRPAKIRDDDFVMPVILTRLTPLCCAGEPLATGSAKCG